MEFGDNQFDTNWKTMLITALVLLVASIIPSPFRRHPAFNRFGPDKLLHFLGHAYFTVTIANTFATERPGGIGAGAVAVGGSALHGLVTGAVQQYVPGRVSERADFVAGMFGSVVGILAWWYVSETTAE